MPYTRRGHAADLDLDRLDGRVGRIAVDLAGVLAVLEADVARLAEICAPRVADLRRERGER